MIKLSKLKNYIFTTKIELDKENYIILREPTQKEIVGISDDENKALQTLEKIFPDCVTESTIENDDGTLASGTEIYNALKDSGSMMTEILTTWLQSIPFQHRLLNNQKSDK